MQIISKKRQLPMQFLLVLVASVLFAGCAQLDMSGKRGQDASDVSSGSYYPTDHNDLMIPASLNWNRENSMVIRTASFAGGILSFSGRVDIDSLTQYFIATMPRDGWKLSGTIKYKNVLLAFTKPNKTSMISIYPSELGMKTEVNIYVTEDLPGDQQFLRERW